jgi:hypothetical protein
MLRENETTLRMTRERASATTPAFGPDIELQRGDSRAAKGVRL